MNSIFNHYLNKISEGCGWWLCMWQIVIFVFYAFIDDWRYTGSFRPKQSSISIKVTILTVIKLSERTAPPSHLYCVALFFVVGLFYWLSVLPTHLHWDRTIKAHKALYEYTERGWIVSYSLCHFVPCAGMRWEGAEKIEGLDLCVCVCFDTEDWIWQNHRTKTLNTHLPLAHTDSYHTLTPTTYRILSGKDPCFSDTTLDNLHTKYYPCGVMLLDTHRYSELIQRSWSLSIFNRKSFQSFQNPR